MTGALRASCLALAATLAAGCAPEFDKVSEIETLRILAVQKDKPYASAPDSDPTTDDATVNLSILWRDTPDKAGRPVLLRWFAGCFNPPGDLIFACDPFTNPSAIQLSDVMTCPPGPGQPCNNKFPLTIPSNILDRPPPADPTQPPYGLAYVFFAVCAGTTLDFATRANERDFPLACLDQNGNRLGSDDFVAGYTSVYVYGDTLVNGQEITNGNPPVLGFFVNDEEFVHCRNDDCLNLPDWSTMPCGEIKCVKPCEDDGEDTCPPQKIRPKIVQSEADLPGYPEPDVVSNVTRNRNITEQMWINYYVESGGVKSEVRLLNDAFTGTNSDYGTEFYAPKDEGMTMIWAVVHDNRGGMSWVGTPVRVTSEAP